MEQISGELEIIIKNLKEEKWMSDFKFVRYILTSSECAVFQFLKKNLLSSDFQNIIKYFNDIDIEETDMSVIDYFDGLVKFCSKNSKSVSSLSIFAHLLETNQALGTYFKQYGINRMSVVNESVKTITSKSDNFLKRKNNKVTAQAVKTTKTISIANAQNTKEYVEKQLINLNEGIDIHKDNFFYGNPDVIESIWDSCLTMNNKTIVVKGEFGVNNLLNYMCYLLNTGDVPELLKGKKLLKVDFPALTNDIVVKGVFENKFRKIIEDVASKNKYILVIDNTQNVVDDETYKDFHFNMMVDEIIATERIPLIIIGNMVKSLKSHTYKFIDLEQYTNSEMYSIANRLITRIQEYHNVHFDESVIVKLFNKLNCELSQLMIMCQLLDNVAANKIKDRNEFKELDVIRDEINEYTQRIDNELNNTDEGYDELMDELTGHVIELNAKLRQKEKEINLNKNPMKISGDELISYIQKSIDNKCENTKAIYTTWLNYLNETNGVVVPVVEDNNHIKLKNLNQEVKNVVIGQDEAIDQLCQVVKKQQLGFNMDKPSVVLCTGSTGVGKTYLCKTLAKKIYGNESHLVRLDMSEYAEKNSVSKLYGTSAGYVGYENGGILTEAIKKAKKGILLLDEIEKAHSEVFDAFLQVFDDGRLTDNHGETVLFKDFVIVMTSNIGAEESSKNQGGIGFKKQEVNDYKKEMIEKAMKSRFKPEFLNRIDKIVHFHTLNEDNLKLIIRLELDKMANNIKTIGYLVGEEPYDEELVSFLFDMVKNDKEYGARPIIRVIKNEVENKLIQKIIDEDLDKGYTFEKIWSKD